MSDDEFDPTQAFLKKVQTAVTAQIRQALDQVYQLATEVDHLKQENKNLRELLSKASSALSIVTTNGIIQNRSLFVLTQELESLELYLADKDPKLSKILSDCHKHQQEQLKKEGYEIRDGMIYPKEEHQDPSISFPPFPKGSSRNG